jgi:Undecaprenyl-phosphate galactose phosphotransferase WbaP
VKGQIEDTESEVGTATLSTSGVRRGLFQSHEQLGPVMNELDDSGQHVIGPHWRPFSRRVGAAYSWQVFINSLPLLIADFATLTATLAIWKLIFIQLGWNVGIDVTAGWLPIAAGFILLNCEMGLYPGVKLSPVEELRRISVSVTCMFVVWSLSIYMLNGSLADNKWLLLGAFYVTCLLALPVARSWSRRMLGTHTSWGIPALVCGDDAAAIRVFNWLTENHHLGLRPVGVIGDPRSLDAGPDDKWYAGSWSETTAIAEKRRVFWAVVVPPEDRSTAISSLVADYLYTIPQVHVLSELTGLPDHWNPQQLDGLAGIHLQQNLMLPLPRFTKRCMDIVASVIGGVFLLPVLFYICMAVKMSSRGPIFYSQDRVGRYGRKFPAWKFRTMFQNSNALLEQYLEDNPELRPEWDAHQKLKYDPRITRIGKFLRKTSLDELPQLWNVLRGDMTLVGPRPMMPSQIEQYGVYYPLYTMVSPGITGLWQVSGRNEKTFEERAQLDAYYVQNWSPWLDVLLLIKTIRVVAFAKGAY